jgi:hypothetical protein
MNSLDVKNYVKPKLSILKFVLKHIVCVFDSRDMIQKSLILICLRLVIKDFDAIIFERDTRWFYKFKREMFDLRSLRESKS